MCYHAFVCMICIYKAYKHVVCLLCRQLVPCSLCRCEDIINTVTFRHLYTQHSSVLLLAARVSCHITFTLSWNCPSPDTTPPVAPPSPGADDVQQLQELGEEDFRQLCIAVGMAGKPLHMMRFSRALQRHYGHHGATPSPPSHHTDPFIRPSLTSTSTGLF